MLDAVRNACLEDAMFFDKNNGSTTSCFFIFFDVDVENLSHVGKFKQSLNSRYLCTDEINVIVNYKNSVNILKYHIKI